jgi:hypothetical protein
MHIFLGENHSNDLLIVKINIDPNLVCFSTKIKICYSVYHVTARLCMKKFDRLINKLIEMLTPS